MLGTILLRGVPALLAIGLALAPCASAKTGRPRYGDVYDCGYTTSRRFEAPDVVFRRSGTYLVAARHRGQRLIGRTRRGTFALRHGRIRFESGPLQPPPGIEVSYFDTHHDSVQIWQLKPAWVPWDCFGPHSDPDVSQLT